MRLLAELRDNADGSRRTTVELARLTGMRQPYVSNLLKIWERVDRSVIEHWARDRDSPNAPNVAVSDMIELGQRVGRERLSLVAQRAAYERLAAKAGLTKDHQKRIRGLKREPVGR
jgi:hypothetical protein